MAIINGTANNDVLTIQTDTTSVQAGAGTDTVVFSGNYADYTFSQSDSFVPLMTSNTTNQVVSLFGVEQLQFDDGAVSLQTTGGGEFQVNSYTDDPQHNPSVATLADGGFVTTWSGPGSVYSQIYTANGDKAGGEIEIEVDNGEYNSVTALNNGGFVVTWGMYEINAQIYNADGTIQGSEFQVNTYTDSFQRDPSIVTLTDGRFVVIWDSREQDGWGYGIYAQIYNADGITQGSEFQVNTYTMTDQASASIAALADGGFIVTWNSYNNYTWNPYGIYAQTYNADGTTRGGEIEINYTSTTSSQNPSIVTLNNGDFVISWIYGNNDIYAQIYNADGTTKVDEFKVNTDRETWPSQLDNNQFIASLIDGGFVVAWKSNNQDGGTYGIYGQMYNADGTTQGSEFQLAPVINAASDISVSGLNTGGFVITYMIDEIYGQIFDSNGNALNETSIANSNPTLSNIIEDMSINQDILYNYNVGGHFNDYDAYDILTYTAALSDGSALPSWLSIDSTTGILSGTPINDNVGSIEVTITATDTSDANISDTYSLTVNNVNDTPIVDTAIPNAVIVINNTYNYDASANFIDIDNGDILSYTATLSDGSALPSWLSIDSTTGILSGTPVNVNFNGIDITVTATDTSSQTIADAYILTIQYPSPNYTITTPSVTIPSTGTPFVGGELTTSEFHYFEYSEGSWYLTSLSNSYTDYSYTYSDSDIVLIADNFYGFLPQTNAVSFVGGTATFSTGGGTPITEVSEGVWVWSEPHGYLQFTDAEIATSSGVYNINWGTPAQAAYPGDTGLNSAGTAFLNWGTPSTGNPSTVTPSQTTTVTGNHISGSGNETVSVGHNFADMTMGVNANGTVVIKDANGNTTTITDVEAFEFADQTFDMAGLLSDADVRPLFASPEYVGGEWVNSYIIPDVFYSGNAGLDALYDYQFFGDGTGNILVASDKNDFINGFGGDDAINTGAGNDIIDGGLGSNFLTGGTGNDTFFSDGREAGNGAITWSTVTDFTDGTNAVNIWGYIDGTSTYQWYADAGATGWTGATLHADLDGNGTIDTSMTFTGMNISEMNAPQGLEVGGNGYLLIG